MKKIILLSISLATFINFSQAQDLVIYSEVNINRDVTVGNNQYVKNTIEAIVLEKALNEYILQVSPYYCPNPVSEHYEVYPHVTKKDEERASVKLIATKLHEISGNNGYVPYNVYLCAYSKAESTLVHSTILGAAEYFDND